MSVNSKSRRKFRFWDNHFLFQTLQQALQVKDKVEEKCEEQQINPQDLPMSLVPTQVLYNIACCYEAMYEKLMKEELLVAGYPKSTKSYH